MNPKLSRRTVLRGAGVAIALPWLESLARPVRAQAAVMPKRFVAIYLPNGAAEYWKPPSVGRGAAWQLSSVLEPLQPLKAKVSVISGLENGSAFNEDGSDSVEPAHGRMSGGWLTCVDAETVKRRLGTQAQANGISVDQVMANSPVFAGKTLLPSLQIGLSTVLGNCDGKQCANSRSVSWKDETTPMYKIVDPRLLFDRIMGVWPAEGVPDAQRDARKSVLDAVRESAGVVRGQLGRNDQKRLDEFLESVRGTEQRIARISPSCAAPPSAPSFPPVCEDCYRENAGDYDRSVHFDLMNELLALALQCDRTRVATYMLEDERSEFRFTNLPKRVFEPLTSKQIGVMDGEWHAAFQNGSQDDFASVVYWHVQKIAALCQRLDGMFEADGSSVLDNSVIFMGAPMHGQNHSAADLPTFVAGSGGRRLRTDHHLALNARALRDFYFTLMNSVYDMGVKDFGANLTGKPIGVIEDML